MIETVNIVVGSQFIARGLYSQLQAETALTFDAKVECSAEGH